MECGETLGIDLGSRFSVVAEMCDGDVNIVPNDVSRLTTPSCASVPNGDVSIWYFGESADRNEISWPETTIRSAKQCLGSDWRNDTEWPVNLSPRQVVAEIFANLVACVDLSKRYEIAAVSVPPYFNERQRDNYVAAVSDSCMFRGIILVDDTAAALAAYAYKHWTAETVVIVDAGGGGTSVAVATVKGPTVHILQMSKRHLPGGDQLDDRLVEYMKEVVKYAESVTCLLNGNVDDLIIFNCNLV